MTGNGLEFVWAAYGLTAVVLVAYAANLWIRAARTKMREQATREAAPAREDAPSPEMTHV
jgi:heme exporter protein D